METKMQNVQSKQKPRVLGVYTGIIEIDFAVPIHEWEEFGIAIEGQFPGLFWDSDLLSSFRIRGRLLPEEETFEALIQHFYSYWQRELKIDSNRSNPQA